MMMVLWYWKQNL